jgi:hypothetical protein
VNAVELLRLVKSDAIRQLHAERRSATNKARAMGLPPENGAADRAEAGWREANPGLTAALAWSPPDGRPRPAPPIHLTFPNDRRKQR